MHKRRVLLTSYLPLALSLLPQLLILEGVFTPDTARCARYIRAGLPNIVAPATTHATLQIQPEEAVKKLYKSRQNEDLKPLQ